MSLEARYTPFALYRDDPKKRAIDEPCRELVGYYKGFIQPVGGSETQRFGKTDEQYTHRCYCPVAVPAEYNDVITQGGVEWTVVFSTQTVGISSVNHHKELLLEQI